MWIGGPILEGIIFELWCCRVGEITNHVFGRGNWEIKGWNTSEE